jgi:hypothetical protein
MQRLTEPDTSPTKSRTKSGPCLGAWAAFLRAGNGLKIVVASETSGIAANGRDIFDADLGILRRYLKKELAFRPPLRDNPGRNENSFSQGRGLSGPLGRRLS